MHTVATYRGIKAVANRQDQRDLPAAQARQTAGTVGFTVTPNIEPLPTPLRHHLGHPQIEGLAQHMQADGIAGRHQQAVRQEVHHHRHDPLEVAIATTEIAIAVEVGKEETPGLAHARVGQHISETGFQAGGLPLAKHWQQCPRLGLPGTGNPAQRLQTPQDGPFQTLAQHRFHHARPNSSDPS